MNKPALLERLKDAARPVRVGVRVTPRAGQDRIDDLAFENDQWSMTVKLRAAPADGEANAALLAFLSKILDVPRTRLTLLRGHTARLKLVEIQ